MKEIYILKGTSGESYPQFSERIFNLIERIKLLEKIIKIKLTLTEVLPPKISIIPFKKEKVAVISIVLDKNTDLSFIVESNGFIGSYEVEEAVPVAYKPTWELGEITPGACLLTLFHSRKDIDYDTFIDRWHNSHTPLSLRLHPLWNYIRNVVKRATVEDSVWYDGIVEEHVRSKRELLNPFIFFGPFFKVPYHMLLVYRDTKSFIDYKRIETYLVNEYIVRR